jgi:hypothetical protein
LISHLSGVSNASATRERLSSILTCRNLTQLPHPLEHKVHISCAPIKSTRFDAITTFDLDWNYCPNDEETFKLVQKVKRRMIFSEKDCPDFGFTETDEYLVDSTKEAPSAAPFLVHEWTLRTFYEENQYVCTSIVTYFKNLGEKTCYHP